jgi:hypothetical protein
MVKIEDLLMPGEKIVKVQEKVQIGNMAGTPVGDLYLTDKRLIFVHSKSWSVLSPTAPYLSPAGVLLGKDIMIPLQDVKSVSKTVLGYVKVKADKEYQFAVSVLRSQGWVDAIMQACALCRQPAPPLPPPPPSPRQEPMPPQMPRPQSSIGPFCSHCGSLLRPDDKFCSNCGAPAK